MTAQPLVVREDLSRDGGTLSKSALTGFDMCATRGWYSLHDPRPLPPIERVTFGSAVDASVEQVIYALRSEQSVDIRLCLAAAAEVIERSDVMVDLDEIEKATEAFVLAVAPKYDFLLCGIQPSIRIDDFRGLGPSRAHPDAILSDNRIFDVKTSERSKPADAAATSVELGWYALLVEEETKQPVPSVGYWTFVRSGRSGWQILEAPVTDELRRRTLAVAHAYIRAKRADEALNRRADVPINWSMTGGPKFAGLCATCAWSPANGGPCELAIRIEEEEGHGLAAA